MGASQRPVRRIGDHLDHLLDLLDRARAERPARPLSDPNAPYLTLLRVIAGHKELERSA
jgi:hypothetical protein